MQTELFLLWSHVWCHAFLRKIFSKLFFLMINRLSPYYITQGMWCRGGRVGGEFDNDLMQ